MMYSTFSSLATPPSPPAPSTFVQGRAVPASSPVVRRRTGSAKGPASPLSDLPFPPSPTFTETDQMNSEEYWGVLIAPLVKQTTHRKQDYGTILSVLVSINSGNPSIIKTVDEAEEISREVGVWFIVRGSERSVVKLGIGANPGLKKYYWRAESSKRLLKREMDADPGHASLVYIIQKANTVSKRCASIPGTDLWLVMYLPATLRAAEALVQGGPASQPRKAATPTRPASPSQVVAHDVASSSSPLSPSSSSDDSSSSSDEEEFSRKRRRPTPSRPSPRSPSIVTPSVSSSSSIEIDASSIHTSKQFDAFCPMPESASSINNAVHSSSSSSDSASSPSEENLKRQCVRKADPAPLPATSTASSSSSASEDSVVPSTTSESLSIPYDINPTGDFFDSCLVTDTCPPFFLDAPSFDGPLDFPLFSPAEPDPFLPLAGSQTIFSAAIEAACMSGHRAPWMNQPLLADFLISDLSY